MAFSTQRVISDGTLELLDISIDYFEREEIAVFFDGLVVDEGDGWNWVGTDENKIAFDPPVPDGVEVLIRRSTKLDEPLHLFTMGAAFTALSMDENTQQLLRIAQEAVEGGVVGDFFQDIHMHGYRITNLGEPVEPGDAVRFETLQEYEADFITYRNQAQTAASNAAASASNASTSESNAADSATASADSATASEAARLAAEGFRDESVIARDAAQAAQSGAELAQTGSESARDTSVAAANTSVSSLEEFRSKWLGPSSTAPTVDGNGDPVTEGDLYWNTVDEQVYVYNGNASAWQIAAISSLNVLFQTDPAGSAVLPTGTIAQRDGTPQPGYARFNSELNQFEGFDGDQWGQLGGGATGAPGNAIFHENDQNVTGDYELPAGKNAMTAGPVEIDDGVTVTIPDGSTWVIV